MSTKIYRGPCAGLYTTEDLTRLFELHGEVLSAEMVFDYLRGRFRGFGFVER